MIDESQDKQGERQEVQWWLGEKTDREEEQTTPVTAEAMFSISCRLVRVWQSRRLGSVGKMFTAKSLRLSSIPQVHMVEEEKLFTQLTESPYR